MKNKNIAIAILICILAAFVMMFWRACRPSTVHRPPSTVTIDTTTTYKPDTGWHVPELPEAKPPRLGDFQAEAAHYRQRYEHYKAEALRRGAELGRLSALLDSLPPMGGCEAALAALSKEVQMYRDQYGSDSAYIEELSRVAQLRNYSGTDSTADWRHHYDITVLGELPAGGYRYKTDFVQRTIERTVTLPPATVWRRRSLAALYGMGADGRAIYAAEGRLQGKRLGLALLGGWNGQALGMGGVVWQW
jgi:hypothetical protein